MTRLLIRACCDYDPEGRILEALVLDQKNHKAMKSDAREAFTYACIATLARFMVDDAKKINRPTYAN